jgi:hypothetical protein
MKKKKSVALRLPIKYSSPVLGKEKSLENFIFPANSPAGKMLISAAIREGQFFIFCPLNLKFTVKIGLSSATLKTIAELSVDLNRPFQSNGLKQVCPKRARQRKQTASELRSRWAL